MSTGPDDSSGFTPGVDAWVRGLGRLRDVVRQELVAEQLRERIDAAGDGSLRVLDAGCGQGSQAIRLARAGHAVTGLDPSAELLQRFARDLDLESPATRSRVQLVLGPAERAGVLLDGRFDLVLCHGVLMYLDDIEPMLIALSDVAEPTAALSLLVRNGLAPAMRAGLLGDWPLALASFDDAAYVNRLGLPAHAHRPSELDDALTPLGWRRQAWYGVRVFTDHRDEPAPDELEALLAAEREAGRRDPYRPVAALLHLYYERTAAA